MDSKIALRTRRFSKKLTKRIIEFALRRARQTWGPDNLVTSITLVYKHHQSRGIWQSHSTLVPKSDEQLRSHGDLDIRNEPYDIRGHPWNIFIGLWQIPDLREFCAAQHQTLAAKFRTVQILTHGGTR